MDRNDEIEPVGMEEKPTITTPGSAGITQVWEKVVLNGA